MTYLYLYVIFAVYGGRACTMLSSLDQLMPLGICSSQHAAGVTAIGKSHDDIQQQVDTDKWNFPSAKQPIKTRIISLSTVWLRISWNQRCFIAKVQKIIRTWQRTRMSIDGNWRGKPICRYSSIVVSMTLMMDQNLWACHRHSDLHCHELLNSMSEARAKIQRFNDRHAVSWLPSSKTPLMYGLIELHIQSYYELSVLDVINVFPATNWSKKKKQ
jgi:hypothetical protein